jgi:hypothetical protein
MVKNINFDSTNLTGIYRLRILRCAFCAISINSLYLHIISIQTEIKT